VGSPEGARPLVWVVVLNWNGAAVIEECLDSLLAMEYPSFRVIVVDNASTDGSPRIVADKYPQVDLLRLGQNLMYAGGNNAGLGRALERGAEAVMLVNNDTRAAPSMLEELVKVLEARPEAGVVGPKIFYYGGERIIWSAGGKVLIPLGLVHHIGIRKKDSGRYSSVREVDYLTGCCLLMRAEAIRSVGMLDPVYSMYSEDVDWCLRARADGWKAVLAPSAHLWHKVSFSSGGGLTAFKAYYKMRNNVLIFRRFARSAHWLTWPPATACWALAMAATQMLRGRGGVAWSLVRGWAAGFATPLAASAGRKTKERR
jgi:GT2 family glycosyltransferase